MRFSLIAFGAFIAGAVASPTLRNVVHEKRDSAPAEWNRMTKPHPRTAIPVRIALTQRNLHEGEGFLLEVSDPRSPKFGQHWTAKQVAETFAPSEETVDAVKYWLTSAGITPDRVSQSQSLNWLVFDSTIEEAEELLKTEYHVYKHENGQPHIGCDSYSIPEAVRDHIDFITPTVHFDTKIVRPKLQDPNFKKREIIGGAAKSIREPGSGSLPKLGAIDINIQGIITQLEQCDEFITPDCLRALYEFTNGVSDNPKNSYGIVEYTPQSYLQGDLNLFFANFSPPLVGMSPKLDSIDGGATQTTMEGFQYNGESDLDLEYAMTLVYPQKVTLYQTGDFVEGASFNNFLDAIDGSYCTFEGGDDPTQDATYPDPFPGGYTGPENCGGYAATNVISTSYGYNEADLTPFYEMRQCAEYMKLGLQGVTVLYSSGDYGVAGNGGQCIGANGTYNNGTSGMFNPSFPSTCPYVTAVGATQVKPGFNVAANILPTQIVNAEMACETVIFSGGGFSNVFAMPSYQSAAVDGFLTNHPPPYGADRFNTSGMSRGYPDVSADGANYVIAVDGSFSLVYGTSASSPVFGSIITLVNEARIDIGKGPVGFLNPTLYANPSVLNDITMGGNQGCGTPGFMATTGWDPVTGLGTPNFPKLLALFLGLP